MCVGVCVCVCVCVSVCVCVCVCVYCLHVNTLLYVLGNVCSLFCASVCVLKLVENFSKIFVVQFIHTQCSCLLEGGM